MASDFANIETDELKRRRDQYAAMALKSENRGLAGFMAAGVYAAQANILDAEIERRASAPLTRTERFTGSYADSFAA